MANFLPWEPVEATTIRVAGKPCGNPKKLTGTRLGKVLNLDSWGSPFQAWCEMCRVAEPPFEGNKYTEAGNVLEPKIIAWAKDNISPYIYTPEEFYGVPDAKQAKRYDFFQHHPVFGGMWDAIVLDGPLGKGKPLGYLECKTSSRPQDWQHGLPPAKYMVQGLIYGHVDTLPRVFVAVRFMQPHEYDDPSKCECDDDNTFFYDLPVETTVVVGDMTIARLADIALDWHEKHVVGNVSPAYDEKKDEAYLKLMRKSEVTDTGLEASAKKAALIEAKMASIEMKALKAVPELAELPTLEKELKALKDEAIKPSIVALFDDPANKNKVELTAYGWKVKKGESVTIDKEAMEADNVLEKYTVTEPKYTMTREKE